jgi:hypothetical protein
VCVCARARVRVRALYLARTSGIARPAAGDV